jgi:hypothetical protein
MPDRITITDQDGVELITVERQARDVETLFPPEPSPQTILVLEIAASALAGLSIGAFLVSLIIHATP